MAEYPTVDVVGECFRDTVRVTNALHLAVGLALQRGGLVQLVRYRDQVLALVIAVVRALARAVLIAFDLGQGVPPQVLGLVGRVDNGDPQASLAVESFTARRAQIQANNVALLVKRAAKHADFPADARRRSQYPA